MASSSRSRSRSNKRSPGREEAAKEKEETEPEVPSPKGEERAPKGEELAPKGKESKPTGEGATPAGEGNAERRTSQSKVRTTGAVQNRRKKGDPGTWTCDECHRTIADNPCSKKQHWDSLYCRAARLYNAGYADGDWEACKKKVERTMYEEEWVESVDQRSQSNARGRGSDPPPEPVKPPRSHGRSPERCLSGSARMRSHARARSSGRQRRVKSADRNGRRNRSRSRDRRAREGERRKSHKEDQEADHEEYVKVVVEKYEPRPRQTTQRQEAIPRVPQKPPPPRPVVKQEPVSSERKDKRQPQQRGKTTAAAEDGHASSSEYTYEYESSTPEGGDVDKTPMTPMTVPAGKRSAAEKDTAATAAAQKKGLPPQKAEGKDRAAGKADAAGQRKDLMVALLQAAMETANKSFQ